MRQLTRHEIEQERRAWVERHEHFRDFEEDYPARIAAAATPEEARRLEDEMAATRKAHREADVALGKRAPGFGVASRQIMWARWFEVAVEHELAARTAFHDIVAKPHSDPILREFRASLVAIAGAAHTIEAAFEEITYLIPPQRRRAKRHKDVCHGFAVAFGIPDSDRHALGERLAWLFTRRDAAVHPYTEVVPVAPHPAGINTGVENAMFHAVTSGDAIDTAVTVLQIARRPPRPDSRWIARWAIDRAPYFEQVVDPLRAERDANPLQLAPAADANGQQEGNTTT